MSTRLGAILLTVACFAAAGSLCNVLFVKLAEGTLPPL
jgi:hypothetical protein